MSKKIPVVFLTDNNYVIPTIVAIQSMLDNSSKDVFFDIYIIAKDVTSKNKQYFLGYSGENSKINIVDIKDLTLEQFDEQGYYVSSTALLKFNIPDLLPQYDKVLYIDGDILVLKDIYELYDIDITGYCVAAVPDQAAIDSCHFDEHLDIWNYFNSGVMVLNAKLIRDECLCEKLYETKKRHPEYQCMDQDVFNDVFSNRVRFLPPRFNLMFYNFILAKYSLARVNEFYNVHYSSFEQMENDAVIIHLTNEKKPWKYKDAYKASEWMTYYKKTALYKNGEKLPLQEESSVKNEFLISTKGPFRKVWTTQETTLYLLKYPLVKKKRVVSNVYFKIFGICFFKKIANGLINKYYFCGFCFKTTYDFLYLIHRLNVYTELIKTPISEFASEHLIALGNLNSNHLGNASEQLQLYKEFKYLETLKSNHNG